MPTALRFLLFLIVCSLLSTPALAVPGFYKQYVAKYSESPEGYEDTVKEAKCLVCHKGKKKKNRNAYGDVLHELLHKKDKNDVEKIVAALETVAALSSDPETEGAPTFGELIAEGKLPGGTLEELKEDPQE